MPIYRRKDSSIWYFDVNVDGRRVRRSTGTDDKRKAQEYFDRLKVQTWEQERIGAKPRYTWRQTVIRFIQEAEHEGKASLEHDRSVLRWLNPFLGDKHLDEIGKEMISTIIAEKQKSYIRVYKMRIPRHLDSDSSGNWTGIPRVTGQMSRSERG